MAKGKEMDGQTPKPEERQRRTVASALAIMIIEDHIRKGGTLSFPGLGIELTKDDLVKPEETGEVETTEK